VTRDDRLRIAVFIDFDNIEIGVKNTLGASFDAGLVLEALRERGDVVSKTAYSDWQRAGGYSRMLTQHAIKMVQRNLTPGGDKNGADINLALDALEMAFTHPHINAFVIVGGDSDFISLVEKLKQYDKKVFVVGGRQFSSNIMQRNCHEFIAYENLVTTTPVPSTGGRRQQGRAVRVERTPIEQVIPLVNRALQVLSEREVSPQMGLLKTTLLQLDSTFSEREYGAGSFRDFVQKLEKAGVVKVHHAKGGLLVVPAEGGAASVEPSAPVDDGDALLTTEVETSPASGAVPGQGQAPSAGGRRAAEPSTPEPAVTGTMTEGVAEFRRIVATGQVRRWPMYLRNVKQLIRQVEPNFDERAYGFANLVDLLRAATKDGFVRVDRDRQGVIRIFQGPAPGGAADTSQDPYEGSTSAEALEATTAERGSLLPGTPGATVIEFPAVELPLIPEPADADPDADPGDVNGNRVPAGESASASAPATTKRPRRRAPSGTRKTTASRSAGKAANDPPGEKRRTPRPRRVKR
jgi:uncharacterized LabA/DUF88 family protein